MPALQQSQRVAALALLALGAPTLLHAEENPFAGVVVSEIYSAGALDDLWEDW